MLIPTTKNGVFGQKITKNQVLFYHAALLRDGKGLIVSSIKKQSYKAISDYSWCFTKRVQVGFRLHTDIVLELRQTSHNGVKALTEGIWVYDIRFQH